MSARLAAAHALTRFMREKIPLARAMDVQLAECRDDMISLRAPLAPNANDKGCAFGGSLVSLMTLNGWALVELPLRARGIACDLFVGDSTVSYLAPLWRDFHSEARLADGSDWSTFFATLEARGKATIGVACMVPTDDGAGAAATLSARFVAKRRK
ncbi:MAG: YiiD C-terminal domain-containing protein [Rhodanobacter sp.]